MKTEKEKLMAGLPYYSGDEELTADRMYAKKMQLKINNEADYSMKTKLLKEMFGSHGENLTVDGPIYFDYGYNIHVGENFYANIGCIILDCSKITIGDNCMLAPNVQIYGVNHPLNAVERNTYIEYSKPVTIGNNAWIGGGAIILPGVTLLDNVVVAAGSVVTKSFEGNVLIAGNPAKIIKKIY